MVVTPLVLGPDNVPAVVTVEDVIINSAATPRKYSPSRNERTFLPNGLRSSTVEWGSAQRS
jgi:hypothetical protein